MEDKELKLKSEAMKKAVGKCARTLRMRAGFKNAESAAEAVGVSATSIYEIERGENWISPEMLVRMIGPYRATPVEFFSVAFEGQVAAAAGNRRLIMSKLEELSSDLAKINALLEENPDLDREISQAKIDENESVPARIGDRQALIGFVQKASGEELELLLSAAGLPIVAGQSARNQTKDRGRRGGS